MGYRDLKLALSTSQAVTADANSEDYIDTELTYPGWQKGWPAAVIVSVEAVSAAGTGINIQICHKATGQPTNGDTTLTIVRCPAANLTVGSQIVIPLPQGIELMRYVGLYYDIIGGSESYTLSAYLTPMLAPI